MANHNLPTQTSAYIDFVSQMDYRYDDLARGLDPATSPVGDPLISNLPVNSVGWSSGNNNWRKWNGSTWVDLATSQLYSINISGNAGTVTGGVYTTGDQTIAGTKTFSSAIAASITGNAATANSASSASNAARVGVTDRRSVVQTPAYFGAGVDWSFMANSTDGLSDGGGYHGVMHYQPYSDATGGGAYELGFTDNNNLWLRGSSGALTTFAAWKKILDSSNYTSYSPTLTGGSASGTWGINITGNAASATSATSANTASQVTIHYNDNSNSSYQMLWGSVNGVYGTAGIYCNPAIDTIYATEIQATSDERLKTNWRSLPDDFVKRLSTIKSGIYDRVDIPKTQAGSSAQDWQKLLPEVVSEDADGMLSLAYANAALVSVIELAKEIQMLKEKFKQLENK